VNYPTLLALTRSLRVGLPASTTRFADTGVSTESAVSTGVSSEYPTSRSEPFKPRIQRLRLPLGTCLSDRIRVFSAEYYHNELYHVAKVFPSEGGLERRFSKRCRSPDAGNRITGTAPRR